MSAAPLVSALLGSSRDNDKPPSAHSFTFTDMSAKGGGGLLWTTGPLGSSRDKNKLPSAQSFTFTDMSAKGEGLVLVPLCYSDLAKTDIN